jgi:phosphoglycolate phosphatase-like HAD superfamily hydrolase
MFVVFDLDGTLANTDHRKHLVVAKDWRGFYAACDRDPPHWHMIEIAHALIASGHTVQIWSGRSDEVRDKTEAWLKGYDLDFCVLQMRKEGDFTADDVLKKQWIDECNPKPDLIFDDRDKVVAMWRANGIPCCQVAPGEF